jgi:uncharacterized protein (DUF2235 family)
VYRRIGTAALGADVAKNILIFSDGTGQGSKLPAEERTNVCKLWSACPESSSQVTFYDDGLGSDSSWWRWSYNLASRATGLGISQNVKDCYSALIQRYEPGDRIYLFGFSRGAYTVRSLGGVLSLCGVPTRDSHGFHPRTHKEARDELVRHAVEDVYKTYGDDEATKEKRKALGRTFRADFASVEVSPYFIGVWDTVRALGIPGSSGLVIWRHAFHDHTLGKDVRFARQALSVDENRQVFEPVPWEETPADLASGRIRQVWFPGVHSDIGGGYPESGLSDLALQWMINEATSVPDPIVFDGTRLTLAPSPLALQHDERKGLGMVWRKGTRQVPPTAVLVEDATRRRFDAATVPTLDGPRPYRPDALRSHAVYKARY